MGGPEPIFAEGVHVMSVDGQVSQVVTFEYRDEDGYYFRLSKDPQRLLSELRLMMERMQGFLDEEVILINGERVRARVVDVALGFRGSRRRPYVKFIIKFGGRLRSGVNRYDDYYGEEVAEYDYEILWIFPSGFRVLDFGIAGEGQVLGDGNVLRVFVPKGTDVGGHEYIVFSAP